MALRLVGQDDAKGNVRADSGATQKGGVASEAMKPSSVYSEVKKLIDARRPAEEKTEIDDKGFKLKDVVKTPGTAAGLWEEISRDNKTHPEWEMAMPAAAPARRGEGVAGAIGRAEPAIVPLRREVPIAGEEKIGLGSGLDAGLLEEMKRNASVAIGVLSQDENAARAVLLQKDSEGMEIAVHAVRLHREFAHRVAEVPWAAAMKFSATVRGQSENRARCLAELAFEAHPSTAPHIVKNVGPIRKMMKAGSDDDVVNSEWLISRAVGVIREAVSVVKNGGGGNDKRTRAAKGIVYEAVELGVLKAGSLEFVDRQENGARNQI